MDSRTDLPYSFSQGIPKLGDRVILIIAIKAETGHQKITR
jgi:hypothetical protein